MDNPDAQLDQAERLLLGLSRHGHRAKHVAKHLAPDGASAANATATTTGAAETTVAAAATTVAEAVTTTTEAVPAAPQTLVEQLIPVFVVLGIAVAVIGLIYVNRTWIYENIIVPVLDFAATVFRLLATCCGAIFRAFLQCCVYPIKSRFFKARDKWYYSINKHEQRIPYTHVPTFTAAAAL
mmetsp:Transcript_48043/g.104505  ORF Transcript_48043/g.104505 Transcript_48043/m.104505 type:complete len:182 (-) Transcript_48043:37-582(-)|eukprot:CAMPEP_0204271180 /NCGR_PEP_ID=MMETSP0468-20130131/19314_1 /ASSEMBLY_ACC=CAM_ASM_000383 /TAXON_ID=2969 /ORGANISM="Oxyrrhis marina" /LENGTH=181 /DNA_ID=CAMNT_0051246803 /DNA_START=98 /DNA_END=643 /DNA_ORIENTATION=-